MSHPTVSVAMITYNHEKYIEEAINSVLMQQCDFEVELVITNDKSTDKTDAIIKQILSTHKNASWIKYINREDNLGMMGNYIRTFTETSGKYIAICEGDDFWTDPLKLQKQVDFFKENPETSFVFHASSFLLNSGETGTYKGNVNLSETGIISTATFLENESNTYVSASSMLRSDVVSNMPDWFKDAFVGDYPIMFLALEKGKIGYLTDNMATYRIASEGSWSSSNLSYKKRLSLFKKKIMLNNLINEETERKYQKYITLHLVSYIARRFLYKFNEKVRG